MPPVWLGLRTVVETSSVIGTDAPVTDCTASREYSTYTAGARFRPLRASKDES